MEKYSTAVVNISLRHPYNPSVVGFHVDITHFLNRGYLHLNLI